MSLPFIIHIHKRGFLWLRIHLLVSGIMYSKIVPVLLFFMLFAGCTMNPQDLATPPKPGGSVDQGILNGQTNGTGTEPPQENLFTMQEVAKHNTKDDCWMVINGKVLDLTTYVSHPGGDTYVPYCGTDGTQGFNDKGGIDRNHSSYAFAMIDPYTIGEIGKPMPGGTSSSGTGNTSPDTNGGNDTTTPPTDATPPANASQNASTPFILTMGEVAKHDTANDCWMVIYGKVLNMTVFSSHPGGSTYVPFCGTEATQAFDTKGGSGNRHSSSAVADLAAYIIGELGQPQNRSVDAGNITITGGDDDDEWEDEEEDD
jgi:cytochrome b involved in lipid metabolism